MGITITTDDKPVKVYRNDKNGYASYAIRLTKKEGDNYVSQFQPIRFRRGVEVRDRDLITITDAFPAVDSWVKDNKQYTRIVWQILEFVREGESKESDYVEGFSSVDDEVPF